MFHPTKPGSHAFKERLNNVNMHNTSKHRSFVITRFKAMHIPQCIAYKPRPVISKYESSNHTVYSDLDSQELKSINRGD